MKGMWSSPEGSFATRNYANAACESWVLVPLASRGGINVVVDRRIGDVELERIDADNWAWFLD